MRATLSYTVLRLGLFVVVFLLLAWAGARSLLLLGGAILISGVISYFLLSPQRNAMSGAIAKKVTGFRAGLDAGTRAEDGVATQAERVRCSRQAPPLTPGSSLNWSPHCSLKPQVSVVNRAWCRNHPTPNFLVVRRARCRGGHDDAK